MPFVEGMNTLKVGLKDGHRIEPNRSKFHLVFLCFLVLQNNVKSSKLKRNDITAKPAAVTLATTVLEALLESSFNAKNPFKHTFHIIITIVITFISRLHYRPFETMLFSI